MARKKIRSKKGIAELQNILRDYHQNEELAAIILEVLKLLTAYENAKRDEPDEPKDSVSLEEYAALEAALQKTEASCRELIKVKNGILQVQQQLKVYSEDLEQRNSELEHNSDEMLKSTKQIVSGLKRELQRLVEENSKLKNQQTPLSVPKTSPKPLPEGDHGLLRSLSKGRRAIDVQQESLTSREGSSRGERSVNIRRNSLSSIRNSKR